MHRTEKRDRARDRILGRLRVCRDALALRSWIVEAMGGAGIERDRDLAAARAACRDESLTALRRHFLVGRADEHRNARVRLVAALREGILQSTGRIERKRGGETLLRRGREACVRRHCGKRCAAAIRPALQADTCAVDLTARTTPKPTLLLITASRMESADPRKPEMPPVKVGLPLALLRRAPSPPCPSPETASPFPRA